MAIILRRFYLCNCNAAGKVACHLPAVLCNNISFVSDQSTYHLHTSNDLQILHSPSVRSDFNPLTVCNRIWNTLPEFARSCRSFVRTSHAITISLCHRWYIKF
ncbi:uncharacterized protein LOC136027560 [Artemia franciscana]|uniref:uncharacterized protein LOC136027560 n=1 Tax=Artemia franciscana TaxID=6661 RepID=UPI0032DB106D